MKGVTTFLNLLSDPLGFRRARNVCPPAPVACVDHRPMNLNLARIVAGTKIPPPFPKELSLEVGYEVSVTRRRRLDYNN
jgi:hypothetical protein